MAASVTRHDNKLTTTTCRTQNTLKAAFDILL